ncbi:MAG: hypothetical protein PHF60_00350 [Candidatus ainarchaeum sp.]|nr:hypothetical protein [Candidatus ainarchaeum sp.]
MVFSIRLPESDRSLLLILAILYLVTRLPTIFYLPFVQDEALYAVMIQEQIGNASLIPTFLSYPVSWKPPLFFWTYAAFTGPLLEVLPMEAAYRLPSLIFGLAAILPLYFLLRNAGASRNLAFFTILISLFALPSLYPQAALLIDSLLFLLICSSLYLYTERNLGAWRFIPAGAIVFAAFFAKLVVAFIIPILAVAYLYLNDKKSLHNPLFILSLLAAPAAFLLHFTILQSSGLEGDAYISDVGGHLFGSDGIAVQVLGSLSMFLSGAGIWFALSIFGLWKHWRDNLFMAGWYCLIILPIMGGYFMPWYYLPVLPAISYFAAITLLKWDGKEKPDRFFFIIMVMLLCLSAVLLAFIYSGINSDFIAQKEAGLMLSGKENVLVVGNYAPGVLAYKMLSEKQDYGRSLDVAWIQAADNFTADMASAYIHDYHTDAYPVSDGSFSGIFYRKDRSYRKDSNITMPEYVAIIGPYGSAHAVVDVLYNRSNIIIYKVD